MHLTRFLVYALVAASMSCVTSCGVDDSYDLDNIDKTISVGGHHFAFPLGRAEKHYLKKVLETSPSKDLVVRDGNYYFQTRFEIPATAIDIDLNVALPNLKWSASTMLPIPALGVGVATDLNNLKGFTIQKSGGMRFEVHDKRLKEVALISNAPKQMVMGVDLSGVAYKELDMKEVSIMLPRYILIHREMLPAGATLSYEGDNVVVKMPKLVLKKGQTIDLYIDGFNLSEAWNQQHVTTDEYKKGWAVTNNQLSHAFNYTITCKTMDIKGMQPQSGEAKVTSYMVINGMLQLKELYAKVEMTKERHTESNFAQFPNKLKREACYLNPSNVNFIFQLDNQNKDAAFQVDGNMSTSYTKSPVSFSGLQFKSGNNIAVISKVLYQGEHTSNVVLPSITNLLQPVPNNINANFQVKLTPDHFVRLANHMSIGKINAKVEIPFAFDEKSQLAVKDTIKLGTVDENGDMLVRNAQLVLEIENTIPMNLTVVEKSLQLLDEREQPIKGLVLSTEANDNVVKGSPDGKTPVKSQIILNLEDKDGTGLKKLFYLTYDFAVTPSAFGVFMCEDQYFKAEKIYIKVPNGIIVNDNKKK